MSTRLTQRPRTDRDAARSRNPFPSTGPAADPVRIAERLSEQRDLWQGLVDFDPDHRYYTRIAAEPDFEAWLLTWLPGQQTDWHDHGGSAGAFVVLQGTLTEQIAAYDPIRPPQIVPGARELGTGALRAFGRHHVHQVTNAGGDPAISLHVYAPALIEMTHYTPYGDLLDVVEQRTVGSDW